MKNLYRALFYSEYYISIHLRRKSCRKFRLFSPWIVLPFTTYSGRIMIEKKEDLTLNSKIRWDPHPSSSPFISPLRNHKSERTSTAVVHEWQRNSLKRNTFCPFKSEGIQMLSQDEKRTNGLYAYPIFLRYTVFYTVLLIQSLILRKRQNHAWFLLFASKICMIWLHTHHLSAEPQSHWLPPKRGVVSNHHIVRSTWRRERKMILSRSILFFSFLFL